MTSPHKALACFEAAGFRFDITHFDHRLMAQKLVYLFQELGVKLGYEGTYSFYLRGTYSPRLTKDLFAHAESPATAKGTVLSKADRARIAELTDVAELRPHLLEVMAAYRFLRRHGKSDTEAMRMIKTTKPFLSDRDVAIGVSKCKGILPELTEVDFASLRKEMEPWEEASAEDEW